MMDRFEVEELILGMADLVMENRTLRAENERLQKMEQEFHAYILQQAEASEKASQNMLKAALVGITMGKQEAELARELVDYI